MPDLALLFRGKSGELLSSLFPIPQLLNRGRSGFDVFQSVGLIRQSSVGYSGGTFGAIVNFSCGIGSKSTYPLSLRVVAVFANRLDFAPSWRLIHRGHAATLCQLWETLGVMRNAHTVPCGSDYRVVMQKERGSGRKHWKRPNAKQQMQAHLNDRGEANNKHTIIWRINSSPVDILTSRRIEAKAKHDDWLVQPPATCSLRGGIDLKDAGISAPEFANSQHGLGENGTMGA